MDLTDALSQSRDRITEMLRPSDGGLADIGTAALRAYGTGQNFGQIAEGIEGRNIQKANALRQVLMGERQIQQQDMSNQLKGAELVFKRAEMAAQRGDRNAKAVLDTVNALTDDPGERVKLLGALHSDEEPVTADNVQSKAAQYAQTLGVRGKARTGDTEFERLLDGLPPERQAELRARRVESLSKGGSPLVDMGKQETEYDKARGKQFAEEAGRVNEAARNAREMITNAERMSEALMNPDVYTGFAGETINRLKQAAKSLGIDVSGVGDAEVARAIGNQMALQLRNPSGGAGMPGALSDRDREFLVAMVPGLQNTREGNQLLLDYMKRVSRRNIEVERELRKYERDEGRLDAGFYDRLESIYARNPLFTDEDRQRAERAKQGQALPTAGATIQPPSFTEGQRARNPKTGEVIEYRGGQWQPVR